MSHFYLKHGKYETSRNDDILYDLRIKMVWDHEIVEMLNAHRFCRHDVLIARKQMRDEILKLIESQTHSSELGDPYRHMRQLIERLE